MQFPRYEKPAGGRHRFEYTQLHNIINKIDITLVNCHAQNLQPEVNNQKNSDIHTNAGLMSQESTQSPQRVDKRFRPECE